jgi:hypothetical protein
MASTLRQLISPIQAFIDSSKKLMIPKKEEVESLSKKYELLLTETVTLHQSAQKKSKNAKISADNYANSPDCQVPIMDVMLNIGQKSLTVCSIDAD